MMCRLDARLFPFDTQRCKAKFAPMIYNVPEMDLVLRPDLNASESFSNFMENGVWDLTDVLMHRHIVNYGAIGDYSEIVLTLVLRRQSTFYVLTIIVPCFLLTIINLMVFILPTESGEKVSLGITNVLALVLFQQLIGEIMPPTSNKSPLIGKCQLKIISELTLLCLRNQTILNVICSLYLFQMLCLKQHMFVQVHIHLGGRE